MAASISEADIGKIQPGQKATFTLTAYPNRTFTGTVAAIEPAGTTTSNVVTYQVLIAVDKTDVTLLPSMTATVTIITQEADNAVIVPNSAIAYAQTAGGGRFAGAARMAPRARMVRQGQAGASGAQGQAGANGGAGSGGREWCGGARRQRRGSAGRWPGRGARQRRRRARRRGAQARRKARRARQAQGGDTGQGGAQGQAGGGAQANGQGATQGQGNAQAGQGRGAARAQAQQAQTGENGGAPVTANAAAVFVMRNGQPMRVPIQTGISDGTNTVVLSGLQAGERW